MVQEVQIWQCLRRRTLGEDFNVDHLTIGYRLKKYGKIFIDLLQRNEQSPYLKNLVTEDETRLLFKNVKRKGCVLPGISPEETVKAVNGKRQLDINSDVYLAQIDHIHSVIDTK